MGCLQLFCEEVLYKVILTLLEPGLGEGERDVEQSLLSVASFFSSRSSSSLFIIISD